MSSFTGANDASIQREDEYLFGWDPMPGIVSVWASREGQALVWRREVYEDRAPFAKAPTREVSTFEGGSDTHAKTGQGHVVCLRERFFPWVIATSLDDLSYLGAACQPAEARNGRTKFWYKELDGPPGSYRYLLMSEDGRMLERALVEGASKRLGYPVGSLNDLTEWYYRVGPVEQYLMLTGRVYFRGLTYEDLHRLQFDLETTALDPRRGRIFMVAIHDSRGFSTVLEAPSTEDEARLIRDLCAIIQEHDPDIIENHNLFGFDLPFLEHRAMVLYRNNNVFNQTIVSLTP